MIARWQPTRCGLVNLYRWDNEEFHFECGRLLLRGHNGTGKSRVLALTLPFLLDGEVSSHRLEPDGDPARRIEWNLLMNDLEDRLGYTWLEFGRLNEDGRPEYYTVGCGLAAHRGKGLTGKWFFQTHQRVNLDLPLMSEARVPFSKERLTEAIGGAGRVVASAREHRQAVDAVLFKLGTERYQALMDLLIALRQPQLSRKLDEARLAATLTQALPRLPESVLSEVAEAFRALENDRQALTELSQAMTALEKFLRDYGRYLQVACKRRAQALREAHNRYENLQRQQREQLALAQTAQQSESDLTQQLKSLRQQAVDARTARETLQESPAMRDARNLEEARRYWQQCQQESHRLDTERAAARSSLEAMEQASARAQTQLGEKEKSWAKALAQLQHALGRAGLPAFEVPDFETSQHRLKARKGQLDHLRRRQRDFQAAEDHYREARRGEGERRQWLSSAQHEEQEARQHLESTASSLLEATHAWLAGLRHLTPQLDLDELREWALDEETDGSDPLDEALQSTREQVLHDLALGTQQQRELEKQNQLQRQELESEQQQLRAGRQAAPSTGRTRPSPLPGAPLYALCDFAEDLNEQQRAGLEAALEGAGLLDAWVTPEGQLLSLEPTEAVIVDLAQPAPEENLTRYLRPAPGDHPIDPALIERLLAQFDTINPDGSWAWGALQGVSAKARAEYVGEGARAEARRRRLEELARLLELAEQEGQRLQTELRRLEAQVREVKEEAARMPERHSLQEARLGLQAAAQNVVRRREEARQAEERSQKAREERDRCQAERDEDAADMGLSDWVTKLDELGQTLHDCDSQLAALQPRWENVELLRQNRQQAVAHEETAQQSLESVERRCQQALVEERAAQTRHATLQKTVGAAVEEIRQRLEGLHSRLQQLEQEHSEVADQRDQAVRSRAKLQGDLERTQIDLESAAASRQVAGEALQRLAQNGILGVAGPAVGVEGIERSLTAAVDAARALEAALSALDSTEAAWSRVQKPIYRQFEELKSELPGDDYRPEITGEDDLLVVSVPYQGKKLSLRDLLEDLRGESDQRKRMLSAREREVIENHLLNDISLHLHDLLHQAAAWVVQVNKELLQRPTSSGMKLKFMWKPREDGPAGLREACDRLMRMNATWSPAERAALGDFLQRQIDDARKIAQGGGWLEHLRTGLDYRQWHLFWVERSQGKSWERLTRKTHGTGSGGEKAIALTVPQFAAAAAYYSASPQAPRLILLDEVFVGVDAKMRGQCMGMLEAFDLDFVMTSEREWGTYAEISGLAIYQLTARPEVDAIYASRWVWNGRQLVKSQPAELFHEHA